MNESSKHHFKRKKPDAKENDSRYIKYKAQQLSTKPPSFYRVSTDYSGVGEVMTQ